MDHVTPHSPNKKQAEMREREFFIKWHDMCYWHSEWISELQVSDESPNEYLWLAVIECFECFLSKSAALVCYCGER